MATDYYCGHAHFDENGRMPLTNLTDLHPNMLQNIDVYRVQAGESFLLELPEEECALLLVEGQASFVWDGNERAVSRPTPFDPAYCLHVCHGTKAEVRASSVCELLVQSTPNGRDFPPVFYEPGNYRDDTFGQGQFEGKAQRTVRTFFDIKNAPYSNMVCGEILIPQGGWSSYPPHEHPQPEVYYYRFGHPNGFGACFLYNDDVYEVNAIFDRCYVAIPGGMYHPQVNAPGYAMYYVWMIRHFADYPWTERNFDPNHEWLLKQ
ncbi:MAG: 5-deoxy-glucuronate isomerase [Oscillospiraceae bacterium]|jgi:5-deoxy-glucuronate isomerase|nr:5-deoxy-glucuronate isomerase [Oscillospiraceae bacterium]